MSFFKVRVGLPGCALLHFASATEPVVLRDDQGRVIGVRGEWLDGCADTLGYLDWSTVKAVTWRRADSK